MRLLTADRAHHGSLPEAEGVCLCVDGDALLLVLDDGEELTFDLEEFMCAVDGERAPGEVEAA